MGVKSDEANLPPRKAIWAGAEALWLTPGLPLVVCARLDEPQWALALALQPSAADLADAEKYPADDRRRRFLQRRAVLRGLAGRALGCTAAEIEIAHDAQGAPQVASPAGRLHVSVAGRVQLAAFGLSYAPIGVDLEPIGAVIEPAWNILHPSERSWLEGQAAAELHKAFLKIWTVKEAYLKMLGLGLQIEPAEVAIAMDAEGSARAKWNRTALASPSPLWGRGETPAMPRVPSNSEIFCFCEWRHLTLGGETTYVAVAAQGVVKADVHNAGA